MLRNALPILLLAAVASADGEWAPGVPFTTDFERAIKEAKKTGKILLIYNGWQRKGV